MTTDFVIRRLDSSDLILLLLLCFSLFLHLKVLQRNAGAGFPAVRVHHRTFRWGAFLRRQRRWRRRAESSPKDIEVGIDNA